MRIRLAILAAALCAVSMAVYAGGTTEQASAAPKVLQFVTISSESVPALQAISETYSKKNPGFKVEVTAIPGVAEFNTAMASKLASGDAPDIFAYQWGTQTQLYAREGQALDLTDTGLVDRLREVKKPVHVYKGRVYALPLVQQSWGLFVNWDAAKKYGMQTMPQSYQGWLDAMALMQKNGLEAPYGVPAQDGSGATGYVFGYLHLLVAGKNPDWYKETLEGTKAWNGPEMKQLLTDYAKALKFANKDMLGATPDQVIQRFARGEAVFYVNGNGVISRIRSLNPSINMTIETFPFKEMESEFRTISDFDTGVSIWSKTKNPTGAKAYLDTLFTVDSGNLLAKTTSLISSVKGAQDVKDPALAPQIPLVDQNKFVGFSEREWVPGIKEIMKKAIQNWMAGQSMQQALDGLEAEHQRLLKAHPEYYQQFMDIRNNSKP